MRKILCVLMTVLMAALIPVEALAVSGDVILLHRESNQTITVSSAATVGDTAYMILRDQEGSAVWAIQAGETEYERFALQENSEQKISYSSMKLFERSGELMALNVNTGKVYSIEFVDGKAAPTGEIALDWKGMYGRMIGKCVASGDELYLLSSDFSEDNTELIAFSLTDGSSSILASRRSWGDIAAYGDGKLVAALRDDKDKYAPYVLHEVSTETGEMTKLLPLADHTARGVSYDEEGERFVYLCSSTIWATDIRGRHTELGASPVKAPSAAEWEGGAGLLKGGYYFVSGYDGTVLTNINPSGLPGRTLTIAGAYQTMDDAYMAFAEEHPEAEVKYLTKNGELTNDEVTQAMMVGSSEVDIYYLRVSNEAFRALAERGYTADLSESDVLSGITERMFTPLREALTEDGKIIAFPGEIMARGYRINTKLAEEIGIDEETYPDTWDKLLDLMESWDESYSKEFPEKTPFDPMETANMKETLIYMLLDAQVAAMNKPGAEVSVDTPFMRETLSRLCGMNFAAFASEQDFSDGYSWNPGDVLLVGHEINLPVNMYQEEGMEPLLLAAAEGEEALIGVTMHVYVVNPYSENIDLAIDYLEARAQTMDKGMQATILNDWTEPLRNPFVDNQIAVYDEWIGEQQEALAKAGDDEKQAIEDGIKEAEAAKQMILAGECVWTEEMLAEYREMAENFVVIQNEYLTAYRYDTEEYKEMQRLASRIVDGQMSADQMLTSFEQKLRMMQLEEGG